MTERVEDSAALRRLRHKRRERLRDLCVVALGAMAVLMILALSGTLGWVEAVTACLVIGAGTAAYYVGSTEPVATEHAREAKRAPPDEARSDGLAGLARQLPFPTLVIGADGRIDVQNDPAREVFEVRPSGRPLAETAVRHPQLLGAIEAALSGARPGPVEIAGGRHADDVWRAHVAGLPPPAGGALVCLEDLSSVRRAERTRSEFLANASHELRTPLTSLAGFIETMRGPARDDPESWGRFLDIMFEQTERMRRLIADLLSLSRIEFSEHRLPRDRVDLGAEMAGVVSLLRPVAGGCGIEVQFEMPNQPLTIIADREEVIQVGQNLITNAIKYSGEGARVEVRLGLAASLGEAERRAGRDWEDAGRMTLQAPRRSEPGAGVWLRVSDTGRGIEREHLPRLGQRFYRVDESRSSHIPGTGLGLAIVKHIMARHRGGLNVESRPGCGSAFGVWFPAAIEGSATPPARDPNAPFSPF